MGDYQSRNLYSISGTGASSVTLPWRPRQLIITNDSTVAGVQVTMGGGSMDLLPDETISVEFQPQQVTVSGATWRLMGFG